MTLKEAKRVRDEVKKRGLWCIVPLGHGPNKYFARIGTVNGHVDFHSETEARAYLAKMKRKRRRQWKEWVAQDRGRRSPIELMVDKACGLC